MTTNETVEQEIQRKGLTAPRVTNERIDEVIVGNAYHVFPGTCLTVCVLTLANGFTVTGESACASPENFDIALGQRIARENARSKVWALEGYALRERLFGSATDPRAELVNERNALSVKFERLRAMLQSPVFSKLSGDERARLSSQAQYMRGYLETLDDRLAHWDEERAAEDRATEG